VIREVISDFLNGLCIGPFLVLLGAVFSTEVLTEAIRSGKVFFAFGGWIGLIYIVRELSRRN